MAHIRCPDPVLLIVAAFSKQVEVLEDAGRRLEEILGPIAFASLAYAFTHTDYYETTMGRYLQKLFLVFQNLVPAESLALIKNQTNEIESAVAQSGAFAEPRPINLDPGILTLGKFMLATTKDQAHRIYLRDGIYAEVTLRFEAGAYHPWPWTYADYRQPCVAAFMKEARSFYRCRLLERKGHDSAEAGG